MSSDPQEYFVIFDTNVLYHPYSKRADFTSFSFNSTFENVVGFINQLDIYEHVTIVVPSIVWREMETQIIEAHQLKLKEFREKASKLIFPEITVEDQGDINYADFIHPVIEVYRKNLSSNINSVIELQIASEARYQSIVERAFAKRPPFEGKDKKSDKGFKDAILWESILEFVFQHDTAKVIFYSMDNVFGCELEQEFLEIFPNARLATFTTEDAVKQYLEEWAKEIDIYSYTPIESYSEHQDLIDWLESADFLIQVIDHDYALVEKGRLITDNSIQLVSFDNIQITDQADDNIEYSIDAVLELTYTLKNEAQIKERINVCICVSHILGEVFFVEDVYISDGFDPEGALIE